MLSIKLGLSDLNFLIMAFSLNSICSEDCLNLVDTENKDVRDHEANKGARLAFPGYMLENEKLIR